MYWEYLLSVLVLLLAIPVAYILARLTKDELRKRRKFFIAFSILFMLAALISIIVRFGNYQAIFFTALFMAFVEIFLLVFSKR